MDSPLSARGVSKAYDQAASSVTGSCKFCHSIHAHPSSACCCHALCIHNSLRVHKMTEWTQEKMKKEKRDCTMFCLSKSILCGCYALSKCVRACTVAYLWTQMRCQRIAKSSRLFIVLCTPWSNSPRKRNWRVVVTQDREAWPCLWYNCNDVILLYSSGIWRPTAGCYSVTAFDRAVPLSAKTVVSQCAQGILQCVEMTSKQNQPQHVLSYSFSYHSFVHPV